MIAILNLIGTAPCPAVIMDSYEPSSEPKPREDASRQSSGSSLDDTVVRWLEEPPFANSTALAESAQDSVEISPEAQDAQPVRRRRLVLPLILFALTCASTFLAGLSFWNPGNFLTVTLTDGPMSLRRTILAHWSDGLLYTVAVLAILLAHEMGHFLVALRHRIPASLPFFLPFPISPLGTLGAVIGMEGSRANRKEIFDIGLAGPIAGLFVAIPMFLFGIQKLDFGQDQFGSFQLDLPLVARWLMEAMDTRGYEPGRMLWQAQLNPLLMAGWVGLFVTGLNMLPVSQLDGGHVIYTLFGRKSYWIARTFMVLVIGYTLYAVRLDMILMIALILMIGTDHPPTRDDTVPLGWFRMLLGGLSLTIPVLCFPLRAIVS